MIIAFEASRIVSLVAFLVYGVLCVTGRSMVEEFRRFGLERFRVTTGAFEVLGALGLLASYAVPELLPLAAGGLALLMLLGVLTRVRLRDTLPQIAPAFVLMVMNGYLTLAALGVVPRA